MRSSARSVLGLLVLGVSLGAVVACSGPEAVRADEDVVVGGGESVLVVGSIASERGKESRPPSFEVVETRHERPSMPGATEYVPPPPSLSIVRIRPDATNGIVIRLSANTSGAAPRRAWLASSPTHQNRFVGEIQYVGQQRPIQIRHTLGQAAITSLNTSDECEVTIPCGDVEGAAIESIELEVIVHFGDRDQEPEIVEEVRGSLAVQTQ